MNKPFGFLILFLLCSIGLAQEQYREDFDFLWEEIDKNYAYFERQGSDWNAVRTHFAPLTDTVSHPYYFTLFLEQVLLPLHDSHTHLRTNTPESFRLLPSGTDLKGIYENERFYIFEIRSGSPAKELLRPGDEVLSINGKTIVEVVKKNTSRFVAKAQENQAREYAFNLALAGDYQTPREFKIRRDNKELTFSLGLSPFPNDESMLLDFESLEEGKIGYIRIQNSLGNTDLIAAFDKALDQLKDTVALILDLRNTPSGGNSNVGIPLLGRFTDTQKGYQTHLHYSSGKKWTQQVVPRGSFYNQPVYVLVNSWTGSMGEGMAIGLDSFGATVIGTPMAGLLGANYTVSLPQSGYKVNIVFEQLFHVNGTPREEYVPKVGLNLQELQQGNNPFMDKALTLIKQKD